MRALLLPIRLAALATLVACARGRQTGSDSAASDTGGARASNSVADSAAIVSAMAAAQDGWNRGDVAAHLGSYADSATFVVRVGPGQPPQIFPTVAAARPGYVDMLKGAHPTLTGETLVLKPLGPDAAVHVLRYTLKQAGQPDAGGSSALVWAADRCWMAHRARPLELIGRAERIRRPVACSTRSPPPRHTALSRPKKPVTRTLPDARAAFVAAIKQDTPGTDLPRLVAVLDALIAWSAARPAVLSFRPPTGRAATVGFERVGAKAPFWSAQVTRGAGAKLEIHGKVGEALSDTERASVIETLNEHSRDVLVDGDRLRIGFGALKNAAAQAAVLALMDRLLARDAAPPGAHTD